MGCSVLILAKNEENNIVDCIESCRPFASEVVVIDDFSSDKTQELAEAHGARVLKHAMNGNWGQQQNFAIESAQNEWIFFIDADERCTPALAAEIKEKIQAKPEKAYDVRRINHFDRKLVRHGPLSPDWVCRLMPKKGSSVEGFVHPKILCSVPVQKLQKDMIHFTYKDWDHYERKMAQYSTLAAKKYFGEGKRVNSVLSVFFRSFFSFLKMYLLKRGFLDGKLGFLFSCGYARYSFDKYVKLYFLSKK